MCRFEFPNAKKSRHWSGDILEREVMVYGLIIRFSDIFRLCENSFQFRGEEENAPIEEIFERLLPDAIASAKKGAFLFVIDGECEHAAEMLEAFFSILIVERENNLSVRVRLKGIAVSFELRTFFLEVVYFAVEDDLVAVKIAHGLASKRREIDNGEAPMSKPNLFIGGYIGAAVVGTAMSNCVGHFYNLSR